MRLQVALRYVALPVLLALAVVPWVRHGRAQPAASLAALVERLSEEGGEFDTDNLISNERTYLEVIPGLKSAGVSGGAYIGVGPDQNFSYIAQVRPSIAFIIDIRRDNLLLHLLFKALFAMSRNRVEYLALLTGRVMPDRLDTFRDATLDRLVATIDAAKAETPAALKRLDGRVHEAIAAFGMPLSTVDFATIERFHHTFVDSALSLKFESRGRRPQAVYPTFRDLIVATDRNGEAWGFLATDASFQFVKSLEARDLVVPVVGNLGGPRALAAIGDYVKSRGERVSAFYISNIETYLFGDTATQFASNVARLPRDQRSVIIRSTFRASVSSQSLEPIEQFVAARR